MRPCALAVRAAVLASLIADDGCDAMRTSMGVGVARQDSIDIDWGYEGRRFAEMVLRAKHGRGKMNGLHYRGDGFWLAALQNLKTKMDRVVEHQSPEVSRWCTDTSRDVFLTSIADLVSTGYGPVFPTEGARNLTLAFFNTYLEIFVQDFCVDDGDGEPQSCSCLRAMLTPNAFFRQASQTFDRPRVEAVDGTGKNVRFNASAPSSIQVPVTRSDTDARISPEFALFLGLRKFDYLCGPRQTSQDVQDAGEFMGLVLDRLAREPEIGCDKNLLNRLTGACLAELHRVVRSRCPGESSGACPCLLNLSSSVDGPPARSVEHVGADEPDDRSLMEQPDRGADDGEIREGDEGESREGADELGKEREGGDRWVDTQMADSRIE